MTTQTEDAAKPNPVNNMQQVRQQIVDAVLMVGSFLGIVSMLSLLIANYQTGWQAQETGLFILLVYWITVTLFRNRAPYLLKTVTVIFAVYLSALFNLIGWGLAGSSGVLFILMVLMSMSLLGTRAGLFSYVIVIGSFATVTFLVSRDILTFSINFSTYAVSISAWLSRMLFIVLVCAIIIAVIGRIIEALRQQLEQFRQHSSELALRTGELTIEMKKREDAELALADVIDHLQDLDRLKDNFIDAVSHELRTPIANIQLYHQLLAMKPEKKDEYLATLKEETKRLSYIVEQMLHASNDSYDMALTTMVDIELKALVNALFRQEMDTIDAKHITLNLSDSMNEYVILASPEHIERALMNLVDNALKYTPIEGQIAIEMLCDKSHTQHMVGVAIQNTGECPPLNERKTIFERFVRGESSLKMGVPGAGLGLPIARQIAEKYAGRVDFTCDEALHTLTFTLWLPSVVPMTELLADDNTTPIAST